MYHSCTKQPAFYNSWRRLQDGDKVIDYVLVYPKDNHIGGLQANERRECFQQNLRNEGLVLEIEETNNVNFVKIHAPKEVLSRYCDIIRIKRPIKEEIKVQHTCAEDRVLNYLEKQKKKLLRPFESIFKLDRDIFPKESFQLLYEYSRDKSYLFDTDSPDFFTESIRIEVVHFILERQCFTENRDNLNFVGIQKLLADKIYCAAYPLHNGNADMECSKRTFLLEEWASVNKWIRHQPLDAIKDYFGVRIAIYFAWLGFYTQMLIPASIIGVICFIYGIISIPSNQISNDICKDSTTIMCPQCDTCDYWYINSTCLYSRISNVFDNNLTVAFALFMSFWATLYLELWKRYSANIQHRWGMTDFSHQTEHPRPEYMARLTNKKYYKNKINVVTQQMEPHVPFWLCQIPTYLFSYSVVLLFMFLAIAAVCGIIIFRMSAASSKSLFGTNSPNKLGISVTAACINLMIISILNYVYRYLAVWLNDLEFKRSQTEYDESLTIKIYLFQFINYYSSIFYIAFLKGKFPGYPAKYNLIFGYRQEECSPGGCLMELCIQLTIIMVGKQALNALVENVSPILWKSINRLKAKFVKVSNNEDDIDLQNVCAVSNQWSKDYYLLAWGANGLFDEYLEMIIQYGFITIFVVAFPLAPLFALINNIFEMRLDAKKFVLHFRRSVPKRVRDIGVWYDIMHIIGKISVISSAFIIAFSSNFIPRMVYHYIQSEKSDVGFLNFSLSYFNTSDLHSPVKNSAVGDIDVCRYSDYRTSASTDATESYKRSTHYWHVMTARLAFIVIFQNVVGLLQVLVAWAIPDTPRELRDQIKRENYVTSKLIIDQEKERLNNLHNEQINRLTSNCNSEWAQAQAHAQSVIQPSQNSSRTNNLYPDTDEVNELFINAEVQADR